MRIMLCLSAVLITAAGTAGCGNSRHPHKYADANFYPYHQPPTQIPGQPAPFTVNVLTVSTSQTQGSAKLLALEITSTSTQPFKLQYLQDLTYSYRTSQPGAAQVLGTFSVHIGGQVVGANPQTPTPLGPGASFQLYLGDRQVLPGAKVVVEIYGTITGALSDDAVSLTERKIATDKGDDTNPRSGPFVTIR